MARSPFNPRPKAAHVFLIAEQFRNASKLLILIHTGRIKLPSDFDLPTVPPVCSAFALELYFKCLIRLGGKPIDMGHDLVTLFGKVGKRPRSEIKRYFKEYGGATREYLDRSFKESGQPMPKFGLEFCLNASRNAFLKMRYIYESGIDQNSGWLCDTIMEGARKAILDKHPEWEDARQLTPRGEPGFQSTSSAH